MNGCKTVPTVRTLSDPPAMEIFSYPPSNFLHFVFLIQFLCLLELACILQKLFKLRLTITNFQPGVVMMCNCVRIAQKFSPTSYVYGFGIINLRSFTSISSHCSINGEKNTNAKKM